MPIPDPPPDPTYYRVLLRDPQGYDAAELRTFLEDSGLKVLGIEELSWSEFDSLGKKGSEKAGVQPHERRQVG